MSDTSQAESNTTSNRLKYLKQQVSLHGRTSNDHKKSLSRTQSSHETLQNLLNQTEEPAEQLRLQRQFSSPSQPQHKKISKLNQVRKQLISPPKITYTQLMMQKQQQVKMLRNKNSSQRFEMLTVQKVVEENLRGTQSTLKSKLSQLSNLKNYSPHKRAEEKSQNKKLQRTTYSNNRSSERSQSKRRAISNQFSGVNLVVPIHQTLITSQDNNLKSHQTEIVSLREISDVLGSKIDMIQNQISNMQSIPQDKLLNKQQNDTQHSLHNKNQFRSIGNQTDNQFAELLQSKEIIIQKLQTQLSIQKRDFQNHERKLEQKYGQEMDSIIQKSSPIKPSKILEPQNELIKQLSTQLRDSTIVIKSQQIQINALKQQIVNQQPKTSQIVSLSKTDVEQLKQSLQTLSEEKENVLILLDQSENELAQLKNQAFASNQEIEGLKSKLRENIRDLANVRSKSLIELKAKDKEISDKMDQIEELKQNLDELRQANIDLVESLAFQAQEHDKQLEQAVVEMLSNKSNEENPELQNRVLDKPIVDLLQLRMELKQEFDLKLAEHVAWHIIEQKTFAVLAAQSASEKCEKQIEMLINSHNIELAEKVCEAEETAERNSFEIQKKLQAEIKQLNAKKIASESQQLLGTMKLQKEIESLRRQLQSQEKESEACLEQWMQMKSEYESQIQSLKLNQPQNKIVQEKEEVILRLERDAELHSQEIFVLENKLKKAVQEIKEAQEQTRDQDIKLTLSRSNSQDQSEKDKKVIKELEKKVLDLLQRPDLTSTYEKLQVREVQLQKQVQQNEQLIQDIRDQLQMKDGELIFAKKVKDEAQNELERLKQSVASQLKMKELDEQDQISQLKLALSQAEDTHHIIKTQLHETEAKLIQQLTKHDQLINQHSIQTESLNSEVQKLQLKLSDFEASYEQQRITYSNQLENQVLNAEESIQSLQNQFEEAKVKLLEFESRISELEAIQTDHLEQIDEYQEEVNNLQQQLKDQDQKHKKELRSFQDGQSQVKQKEKEQMHKIVLIEQELVDKCKKIAELQDLADHAVTNEQQLQSQITLNEELKSQLNISATKQKTLVNAVQSHKEDIADLTQQLQNNQTINEEKSYQIEQLQKLLQNDQQKEEFEQIKKQLESEKLQKLDLELQLRKAKEEQKTADDGYNQKNLSIQQQILQMQQSYEQQTTILKQDFETQLQNKSKEVAEQIILVEEIKKSLTAAETNSKKMILSHETELTSKSDQIQEINANLEQVRKQSQCLTIANETYKTELRQKIQELEQELTQLNEYIEQLELSRAELEESEVEQKNQNEKLILKIEEQANQISELQQQHSVTSQDQILHDTIQQQSTQISQFLIQEEDLLTQIAALEDELKLVKDEKLNMEREHTEEMERVSQSALDEILEKEQLIEQSREQKSITDQENERLTKEYNSVERQNKTMKQQLNKLPSQEQIDKVVQEKSLLSQTLETKQVEIKELSSEIAIMKTYQETKSLENQNLTAQILTQSQELRMLQSQLVETQQQLADLNTKQDQSMQQVIGNMQSVIAERDAVINNKQKQLTDTSENLTKQLLQEQEAKQKLQNQLKSAQEQVKMGQIVMQTLQQEMSDLEKQKQKLQQSELANKKAIEQLTSQLAKAMQK